MIDNQFMKKSKWLNISILNKDFKFGKRQEIKYQNIKKKILSRILQKTERNKGETFKRNQNLSRKLLDRLTNEKDHIERNF